LAKKISRIDLRINIVLIKIKNFQQSEKEVKKKIEEFAKWISDLEKDLKNANFVKWALVFKDALDEAAESSTSEGISQPPSFEDCIAETIADLGKDIINLLPSAIENVLSRAKEQRQFYITVKEKIQVQLQELSENIIKFKKQINLINATYEKKKNKLATEYNKKIQEIKLAIEGVQQQIKQTNDLLKIIKDMIKQMGC